GRSVGALESASGKESEQAPARHVGCEATQCAGAAPCESECGVSLLDVLLLHHLGYSRPSGFPIHADAQQLLLHAPPSGVARTELDASHLAREPLVVEEPLLGQPCNCLLYGRRLV